MAKEIIAAGGLVFNEDNELLMIYRRGKWDLPKGKLDDGESLEECAVREVEEETGVSNIQLGELIDTTLHGYNENDEHIGKKTYWYTMNVSGKQKLVPQEEEGIVGIEWVPKDKVESYLNDSYENIRDIINKSGFLG